MRAWAMDMFDQEEHYDARLGLAMKVVMADKGPVDAARMRALGVTAEEANAVRSLIRGHTEGSAQSWVRNGPRASMLGLELWRNMVQHYDPMTGDGSA